MLNYDFAFSPSARAVQAERGSRAAYAKREASHDLGNTITPDIAAYLAQANSAYLGTVSADGQPYIQHRGGPAGFLKVVDDRTIGFADYVGNRQYITTGNLRDNPKAFLFVMDYANRRRLKIWGEARVTTDPAEIAPLADQEYGARIEQAILFRVNAWDRNCPQHIPQLFPAEAVAAAMSELEQRNKALEAELAALRSRLERKDA
ncbi:MAG: pyridoxamine 5'-phosphate oxidase family protein [Rhodospirillaceae bacterium]|jgi:predicted pyridoxine 5'-phosphate oxidase superfamily flavin-nucleotide-binding protein|nr:pyridoxamine 5'-phosphate oxidase family protein [Rhodospirillaceae bacterium]